MSISRRLILSIVVIQSIHSIVSAQLNPNHSFSIIQEDGIPTALTTGGPKYDTPIFTFVEVARLTPDPSHEDSYLYVPSDFTIDDEGNYYVEDNGNCRIAVFDSDGKYIRSFGREGQGPGEFLNPKIEFLDNNVIQVFDQSQRRLTRYFTDGNLLDVIRIQDGKSTPADAFVSPDGRRIVTVNQKRKRSRNFIDTYYEIQFMNFDQHEIRSIESSRARQIALTRDFPRKLAMYYAPVPQVCYSLQSGIIVSTGAEPEINCYSWYGTRIRKIRFDLAPQPVTRRDQIRIREFIAEKVATLSPQVRQQWLSAELVFPETKAFWHSSRMDDEGFIWLIEFWNFEALDQGRGTTCMVVSPEGELLGPCYLPSVSGRFSQGYFLSVITNESTGEVVPTVFRIESNVIGLDYPK